MKVNRKLIWNHAPLMLCLGMLLASPTQAARAQSPDAQLAAAGKKVFNKCLACHKLDSDGDHGIGPNLYKIVGMKAGTQDNFDYSAALKKSDIVWTPETLDKWITNPREFVPGSKMAFVGVPSEEERKAVIAYIQKQSAAE